MSDAVEDFKKKFDEAAATEDKIRELKAKKLIIDEKRINVELDRITKFAEEDAKALNTNFGQMTQADIEQLVRDNTEYIEAARKARTFINKEFDGKVPFFRKNLILLGGKTGEGKSTTVANIAKATMQQVDSNGKPGRVMILTNEEKREDVFNRITCLVKGWHYTNHDKFTDEQLQEFNRFMPILAKNLTVVDDNYNGVAGTTTSLEGVCGVFDNMIRDGIHYDAIVYDYYQNCTYSKDDPGLTEYEVQAALCHKLDQYKNVYPAPIVVMAQCAPQDDKHTPFEYRIRGRKLICAKATLIMEMTAEREFLRTQWEIHKSRFTEAVGGKFYTGYNKGAFVKYDDAFANKIKNMRESMLADKAKLAGVGKDGKDEKPVDTEPKKE
jgi:hypothetical protein